MDIATTLTTLAPTIVAILTIIFAYLTNKDNNKAKIAEIAYQERLKALSNIVEALSVLEYDIALVATTYQDKHQEGDKTTLTPQEMRSLIKITRSFEEKTHNFIKIYYKNRLYLPREIDEAINKYYNSLIFDGVVTSDDINETNVIEYIRLLQQAWGQANYISTLIQKTINRNKFG